MKKLLLYVFLSLLWCNISLTAETEKLKSFADYPEYNDVDLNENVIEHGWKIQNSKILNGREYITLRNGKYIMKCIIHRSDTHCWLP